MKFSVYFMSFMSIIFIPNTYSDGSGKVIGSSGCFYFGSTAYYCNVTFVNVSALPTECTSFIWVRLNVDANQSVAFQDEDPGASGYVTDMVAAGKPTFIIFGHDDVQGTVDFLARNYQHGGTMVQTELTNLQNLLSQFSGIAGLLLDSVTIWSETKNTDGFSANLKLYVEDIKKTFPDYAVALSLVGYFVLLMDDGQSLNITDLDTCVDFYYVDTFDLNGCTSALATGDSPVNGSNEHTIEELLKKLTDMGISQEKLYLGFSSGPSPIDVNTPMCDATNQQICAKRTRGDFCIDSLKAFYQKGVFAKANAAGFCITDPDLMDDPDGCCQCDGGPYPAFHAVLAGFNGGPAPGPCPLFD